MPEGLFDLLLSTNAPVHFGKQLLVCAMHGVWDGQEQILKNKINVSRQDNNDWEFYHTLKIYLLGSLLFKLALTS
jgi:hypothetical protein